MVISLCSLWGGLAASAVPVAAQEDGADPTQGIAPYLTPGEVLDASARHFPAILESFAARRAARGDVLAAQGAFDLVFDADGFSRTTGFWDGTQINGTVKQRIAPMGASLYGGYRLSDGRFPIYEDEYFTNSGGEAKVGILFSLLRDRSIDARRFKITDMELALRQAEFEVLLTKVGVQHKALRAYWRWVWSGTQRKVYQELLALAENRQSGLETQVRSGAVARIFLTENQQNISRRQRFVAEADREYLSAANALSLYWRDETGSPVTPRAEDLPPIDYLLAVAGDLSLPATRDLASIVGQRPELKILSTAIERARQKVTLSENEKLPRLDLTAELSRDFGNVAQGGVSRDSTDTIIGLRFTAPLQRRDAAGQIRRARAELEAAEQRRRQAEDEIAINLQNVMISLSAAKALMIIAGTEFDQSLTMQDAERERFRSGASDFFLVNLREETAADARIRYYDAAIEALMADADYDAVTLDLPGLGIPPS